MSDWISVYARSPRQGDVLDLKLSDGRVLDQVTIRDPHGSGIWTIASDEFVVAAWKRSAAFPVRVTHFRGHCHDHLPHSLIPYPIKLGRKQGRHKPRAHVPAMGVAAHDAFEGQRPGLGERGAGEVGAGAGLSG